MGISQIIFFISISLIYRLVFRNKGLQWFVLLISLVTIFWLQPISTIRNLDFWLPVLGLSFGIISWIIITKKVKHYSKQNLFTFITVISFMLILGASRFIPVIVLYKFVTIPGFFNILLFFLLLSFVILTIRLFENKKYIHWGMVGIISIIFIIQKNDSLSYELSLFLRQINSQSSNLASSDEIIWIGYSYIAFRVIHALIESRKRNGLEISLRSYLCYLFYFPAFLAGPIDKIDHFNAEISSNKNTLPLNILKAGELIAVGLFQKFIVADTFAVVSITETLSGTITSKFWMWFVVIVYTFRIYFDFNGYSNIALGISEIIGIQLPVNFNKPLISPTLSIFWNNWHITLTQWFRAYFFNPITRFFRTRFKSLNSQFILAFMQISTMVLIGLWHGISYNFIIWGAWIGVGLFLQNRMTGFVTKKTSSGNPLWKKSPIYKTISTILTILYVSLGWVWFALPDVNASMQVFNVLFGM